eukprot:PhF_6_TR5260/c0_g1_i1/m.7641
MYYLPVSKYMSSIEIPPEKLKEKSSGISPRTGTPKWKKDHDRAMEDISRHRSSSHGRKQQQQQKSAKTQQIIQDRQSRKKKKKYHIPESIKGRTQHVAMVSSSDDATMGLAKNAMMVSPIRSARYEIEIPKAISDRMSRLNPSLQTMNPASIALQKKVMAPPEPNADTNSLPTQVRMFVGLVPKTVCGVCGHSFLLPKLLCRISGKSILDLKHSWGLPVNMTLGHLYGSREVCCFCSQFFGVYVKEYDAYTDEAQVQHVMATEHVGPQVTLTPPPKSFTPQRAARTSMFQGFEDALKAQKQQQKEQEEGGGVGGHRPQSAKSGKAGRSLIQSDDRRPMSASYATSSSHFRARRDPSAALNGIEAHSIFLTPDDLPVFHPTPVHRAINTPVLQPLPPNNQGQGVVEAPSCDPVLPEELIDETVDTYEALFITITKYSDGDVVFPAYVPLVLSDMYEHFQRRGVKGTWLAEEAVTKQTTMDAVFSLCERITRRSVVFVVLLGMSVCTTFRGIKMLSADMSMNSHIAVEEIVSRISSVAPKTVIVSDLMNMHWPSPGKSTFPWEGCVIEASEPSTPGALLRALDELLPYDAYTTLTDAVAALNAKFPSKVVSTTETRSNDIPFPRIVEEQSSTSVMKRLSQGTNGAGVCIQVGTSVTSQRGNTLDPQVWEDINPPSQSSKKVSWGVLLRAWAGQLPPARVQRIFQIFQGVCVELDDALSIRYFSPTHSLLMVTSTKEVMESVHEKVTTQGLKSIDSVLIDDVYTFQWKRYRNVESGDGSGGGLGMDGLNVALDMCFAPKNRQRAMYVDLVYN